MIVNPTSFALLMVAAENAGEQQPITYEVSVTRLFQLADQIVDTWLAFLDALGRFFEPVIKPIFAPVNSVLEAAYMPWAKISALSLFLGTMVWVCFIMKKEYVNLGRTNTAWWTDLRLWTVLSMLPHIFVYLYF